MNIVDLVFSICCSRGVGLEERRNVGSMESYKMGVSFPASAIQFPFQPTNQAQRRYYSFLFSSSSSFFSLSQNEPPTDSARVCVA